MNLSRVLIDIRLLSSGKTTGIEEYTRQMVKHLPVIDRDNEYALFYNSFKRREIELEWGDYPPIRANRRIIGGHIHKNSEAPQNARSVSVKKYSIPNKLFDASMRFFGYPKIDAWIRTDLIFSPHFNILSYSRGVKRVMTVHDLSFLHHPQFFSWRKRFWHWLQNYKEQILRADHLIAVSDYTKADVVELIGVPAEKITRIYSGIDASFRKISLDDEEMQKYKRQHAMTRPFFLYMGVLEPRKNIVAIIRAFNAIKEDSRFREFQLVLAGSAGWLYNEIFEEARRSRWKTDIRFLGEIAPHDRVYTYNLAEAFIYPSFFEGFGFPPLEAQACGIAVIASNRSSLPEILGSSALLVDPWRIDDIVVAAKEIVLSPRFKEKMVQAGFQNIRRFDWKKTATETLEIFKIQNSRF